MHGKRQLTSSAWSAYSTYHNFKQISYLQKPNLWTSFHEPDHSTNHPMSHVTTWTKGRGKNLASIATTWSRKKAGQQRCTWQPAKATTTSYIHHVMTRCVQKFLFASLWFFVWTNVCVSVFMFSYENLCMLWVYIYSCIYSLLS